MAKGPKYIVDYRRTRKGKTDYKRRLNLLKSGKPRLIIRKTGKHMIAQLIRYSADGDLILAGVSTQNLIKNGWKHSTSNIPAAYLTGVLIGRKAVDAKVEYAIVDLGRESLVKGGRLYAVVKGAVDAGLKLPVDETVFPTDERLTGEHITAHNKKAANIVQDALNLKDSLMKQTPAKKTSKSKKEQSKD